MNERIRRIYSEVYGVLNLLGEQYINKLPKSLFTIIEEEKMDTYNPQYNSNTSLLKQDLQKDSLAMIALFHLNYWCETEQAKNELKEIFSNQEEKYQNELREKYNPDNLLKKIEKEEPIMELIEPSQTNALVKYQESRFKRIVNKIREILEKVLKK